MTVTAPFDPHAIRYVARNHGVRLATLGYLGHMWELYAMWAWIPAFAAASMAVRGEADARSASLVALTLQTCAGFLLTMVSLRLLPAIATSIGWQWVFLFLVPGPVLGALARWRLAATPH